MEENYEDVMLKEFEELFIKFLCNEGAYFQYMRESQKHESQKYKSYSDYGEGIQGFIKYRVFHDNKPIMIAFITIVESSFPWFTSGDGNMYWLKVSDRYKTWFKETEFYHKYNKQYSQTNIKL